MRTATRAAAVAALVLGLAGCGLFGGGQDAATAAPQGASSSSQAALKYEPAPMPPRQFFEKP